MKYQNKIFTSGANSKAFVDNWDAVFGKNDYTEIEKINKEVNREDRKSLVKDYIMNHSEDSFTSDELAEKLNLDWFEVEEFFEEMAEEGLLMEEHKETADRLEALGFEEEDVKVIVNGINPKKD